MQMERLSVLLQLVCALVVCGAHPVAAAGLRNDPNITTIEFVEFTSVPIKKVSQTIDQTA